MNKRRDSHEWNWLDGKQTFAEFILRRKTVLNGILIFRPVQAGKTRCDFRV